MPDADDPGVVSRRRPAEGGDDIRDLGRRRAAAGQDQCPRSRGGQGRQEGSPELGFRRYVRWSQIRIGKLAVVLGGQGQRVSGINRADADELIGVGGQAGREILTKARGSLELVFDETKLVVAIVTPFIVG